MVDGAVALKELQVWGHKKALAQGLPAVVDPSIGNLVPELGYWILKDHTTANLVWRATKYTTLNGKTYGLGALRMFVDAVTGDFIPSPTILQVDEKAAKIDFSSNAHFCLCSYQRSSQVLKKTSRG